MSKENPEGQNDSGIGSEIIEAEDGGEIITDGGTQKMKTPKETKEKIEGISALARADNHWENTLEVTGHASPPDNPHVTLTLENAGQPHDSAIVVRVDPDQARELAETLQRKADYAEEYAEYRREQEE